MDHARRWIVPAVVAAALGTVLAGLRANTTPPHEPEVLAAAIAAEVESQDVPKGRAICVAIDPGGARQSPSRGLLARIALPERRIVRAAECEVRETGVVELPTGREAFYVVGGPIEWVASDEAWVTTTCVKTRARSITRQYRVVLEDGARWRALGIMWRGLPN